MLQGQLTVRHPEGETVLGPGDATAFPAGPKGAHRTSNQTAKPVRVLMFADANPVGYSCYPDSNKITHWTDSPDPADNVRVRRGETRYFWDGHLGRTARPTGPATSRTARDGSIARRRSTSCARSSPRAARSGRSARGTRSTRSPTPASWCRSPGCPPTSWSTRGGTVSCNARADLRRARAELRRHGARAAQPRPRCRTSRSRARSRPRRTGPATQRQPRDRGRGAGAASRPTASSSRSHRGDADFDGVGRGARRARRGHAPDARRRARLRGPPARLRGAVAGTRWTSTSTRSRRRRTASASSPAGATTSTQVWVKRRVTEAPEPRDELFGARRARRSTRHPILGLDAVNCTAQLGVPGPWQDRLPHFRMGFTPSAGEEIQREYLLPARARCRRRSRPCAASRADRARCCRSPRSARSPPTTSG